MHVLQLSCCKTYVVHIIYCYTKLPYVSQKIALYTLLYHNSHLGAPQVFDHHM